MKLIGLLGILLGITVAVNGAETLKFDFGPSKMPAASGWVRLSNRTIYNKKLGYGWTKEWSRGLKWPSTDPVLKGGVGGDPGVQEGTLLVDLADGVYKLTIQAGSVSSSEGRKGNCLEANGRVVIGAPGMGGWGKLSKRTVPVVVKNGQLKLRFFLSGKGGSFRLSLFSLVIDPVEGPEADRIKKQWDNAGARGKVEQKEVTLNGKVYTELGRIAFSKPGAWAKSFARSGYIAFTRPNPGEILNYTVPGVNDVIKNLSGFASPGERQPYHFGIYAMKKIDGVNIKFSDFTSSDNRIDSSKIKLYTVTCHYQSLSERPGKNVKLAPELLEKKFPFDLRTGETQPVYAVVDIPADQMPGLYKGKVTVSCNGGVGRAFNVNLRVLPLKLQSPSDKDWQLCGDTDRWWQMSEEAVKREIDDIARHGITGIKTGLAPISGALIEKDGKIIGADFGRFGNYLKYARQKGINRTLSLTATNALLWSLKSWRFSGRNGGVSEIAAEGGRRFFKMRNPSEKSVSAVGMSRWCKVPANQKLEFSIRYSNTGTRTVRAELLFFDSRRRRTYKTDKVLYLRPTSGRFVSESGECMSHKNSGQFLISIRFQGKGELTIDNICLKEAGSKLNLVSNPQLLRSVERIDYNKKWPESFVDEYKAAVKANMKAVEKLGFQCFIDGTDEAGNNPRTEHQEISELKYAMEAGGKTWCNLSPELAAKTAKYLDAVCFYADLFGNEKNGLAIIDRWKKAGKEVYFYAAGAYPGQDFGMMPNRYNVGFFFWKSGCDGTAIWTFMRPCGEAFNDFDADFRDHCIVYPPRKEGGDAVPTIVWEGIGEGRRDFNYLYTLEQAVETAKREGRDADSRKGKLILDFIRTAVPWYDEFAPESFDNSAANSLRWLAAWGTMEISGKSLKGHTDAGKTGGTSIKINPAKSENGGEVVTLCPAVSSKPALDGKLDDPAWKKAVVIKDFVYYMNKHVKASEPTEVYLMHDRDNLYLGFKCFSNNMSKLKTSQRGKDGNVFADDSIEMFFNNTNDKAGFYQLCFNASGSQFDLKGYGSRNLGQNTFMVNYGKKKMRDSKWDGDWQVKTSRFTDRWEAEVVIPFKTIGRDSDIWGMFFGRNNRAANETTANRGIGFFDQPNLYPAVAFAGTTDGSGELVKWNFGKLYAGPASAGIDIRGLNNAEVRIEVIGKDSKERTYSVDVKRVSNKINYELLGGDRKMTVQVSVHGKTLLKYIIPLDIPAPLKLKASRQVFFGDASNARVKVVTALSSELASKATIRLKLLSENRTVASASYKAAKGNAFLSIPLKGLPDGFYTLTAELEYNKKTYTREQMQLMLVPGY
jgi:hypothetical protein